MDVQLIIIVVLTASLGIAVYFTPYIIGRNKQNSGGIFVVNLLLGWTLIGWLVAFIWAFVSPKAAMWTYGCPHCGYNNELDQRITLLTCKQCHKETKVASKTINS